MESTLSKDRGGLWQEWPAYFQKCLAEGKKQRLERGNWPTIGHALADKLTEEMSEGMREITIPQAGNKLDAVRSYAVTKMRDSGKSVFIHAAGRPVDVISLELEDEDISHRRDVRVAKSAVLRVDDRLKRIPDEKRKELGWFERETVKRLEAE